MTTSRLVKVTQDTLDSLEKWLDDESYYTYYKHSRRGRELASKLKAILKLAGTSLRAGEEVEYEAVRGPTVSQYEIDLD